MVDPSGTELKNACNADVSSGEEAEQVAGIDGGTLYVLVRAADRGPSAVATLVGSRNETTQRPRSAFAGPARQVVIIS
jgi:hypothetical protein